MKYKERFAFYALLATIPLQIGKHFWPYFSYVHGIRVDYLSPTLHLSDIAFLFLLIFSFKRLRGSLLLFVFKPLFLFLLILFIISTDIAVSRGASFFGIVKFLEFFYIAFYLSHTERILKSNTSLFILTLGGVVEVIISVFQFIAQRSLGGAFYFLGERTFFSSTPGIALFQFQDSLLLRPYGTFPHPNVLAFYLFFCFSLLLFSSFHVKKIIKLIKTLALFTLFLGILLTFSRIVILLLVLLIAFRLIQKKFVKKGVLVWGIFLIVVIVCFVAFRYGGLTRDLMLRLDLIRIGFDVFLKSPLIGIGINNFYFYEIAYQKTITPTLLQPIHNIYLLWICQTGILGALVMSLFIKKLVVFKKTGVTSFLIFSVVIVGLFDHYLVTLQQGQLLLALIIGLHFERS